MVYKNLAITSKFRVEYKARTIIDINNQEEKELINLINILNTRIIILEV